MSETAHRPSFESFAIVELMGHVRLSGKVTEVELFGSKLGKIDVIDAEGCVYATQYFGGSSVYRITPCTEGTAKATARDPDSSMPTVPWDARALWEAQHKKQQLELEYDRRDEEDEDALAAEEEVIF